MAINRQMESYPLSVYESGNRHKISRLYAGMSVLLCGLRVTILQGVSMSIDEYNAYVDDELTRKADEGLGRVKFHRVFSFSDLSEVSQSIAKEWLFNSILDIYKDELMDKYKGEDVANGVWASIERSCNKAWVEMEFEVTL